jgi:hypothetical protein
MNMAEIALPPSRMTQRCYPWVVIGVAFLTVAMAFRRASRSIRPSLLTCSMEVRLARSSVPSPCS